MNQVENLKKITLSFQAGSSADEMNLIPKHPEFTFIFGLAPEGMTPFEYELAEKSEGDWVLLHLHKNIFNVFFEHLDPPLWDLLEDRDEIHLKIKVKEITAPDNREVVKAMADMAARGGSGCDCGCGCS